MSYRVELPVFSGPLDLLLHLVRQQEVDVHEVCITDILDSYLGHLKVLEALDLSDLGDFVVMASTLMEIKSREILPREHVEIGEELNPRDDLIRKLLEYKRYRDISRRLDRLATRRSQMLPTSLPPLKAEAEEQEPVVDLGDIEVWTLTAAFARLLEETGHRQEKLHVGIDRRNVQFYAKRVLEVVRRRPEVHFAELFDRKEGRVGLIGVFVSILEMMKQGVLRAHVGEKPGDVVVAFIGDPALTAEQILAGGERLDEEDDAPEPAKPVTNGVSAAPDLEA